MAEGFFGVIEHTPCERPLPKDVEKCASSTDRCVSQSTVFPHTAPNQETTNQETTMEYIGMDVHHRYSQVAIPDDVTDSTDPEECQIPTERDEFEEFAREYKETSVAFEATRNCWFIYDCLNEYLDITVANPRETASISYQNQKRPPRCQTISRSVPC